MTIGSYRPYFVLNAALCWSPYLICTFLKPHSTSNLVKTKASHTSAISLGIKGSRYRLLIVHWFMAL